MGSKEQIARNCPYCGAIITYDEFFCRACHKRLHDQQNLDAPSTAKPETYIVSGRKPLLAGLLSAISPGLGQFYNGETIKGLIFFLAMVALSFGIVTIPYQQPAVYAIWILAVVDAIYAAHDINHYLRSFSRVSYLLYLLLAVFALIVTLHLLTGQPDIQYLAKLFPPVALVAG